MQFPGFALMLNWIKFGSADITLSKLTSKKLEIKKSYQHLEQWLLIEKFSEQVM